MLDYIEPAPTCQQNLDARAGQKTLWPEFTNPIDVAVTASESLATILDDNIQALQQHVSSRLGDHCFMIEVLPEARAFLLEPAVGYELGQRELKRALHRQLTQPLSTKVARGEIQSGALVRVELDARTETLSIHQIGSSARMVRRPTVLIADENHSLLLFLASELSEAGWEMLTADNASHARRLFSGLPPGAVLLDYMLGDDDGLELGLEFQTESPTTQIMIMTGGRMSDPELALCRDRDIPILFKPFLSNEILNLIRRPLRRAFATRIGLAALS
jgi:CheY-like chemotaxis protein